MISYVYVYLDTRKAGTFIYDDLIFNFEPFYVGKGIYNRAYDHLYEKKHCNNFKFGKIRKIFDANLHPEIIFTYKNLSDKEAQEKEIEIIRKIGRFPNGPLTNLTDGGDGTSGIIRSKESIEKQKITTKNNLDWQLYLKSKEFSSIMSDKMKKYYSIEENRKAVSIRQTGENNSRFGKVGGEKQKEAVRKARAEGKIKLSEKGRQSIINHNKLRKGKKNKVIKSDAKKYILTSPLLEKFEILGSVRLQAFCKEIKIQFHTLKNNIDVTISDDIVTGNRIHAKNTIGWTLNLLR